MADVTVEPPSVVYANLVLSSAQIPHAFVDDPPNTKTFVEVTPSKLTISAASAEKKLSAGAVFAAATPESVAASGIAPVADRAP